MEDKINDLKQRCLELQKSVLSLRVEVPLEAKTTHDYLRYCEQSLSSIVSHADNAIYHAKTECPKLLGIVEESKAPF